MPPTDTYPWAVHDQNRPQPKRIEPGTTYHATDTVFIDISTTDPFTSLETYGMAMRTANQAHPKPYDFPTLCGWLVSQQGYGEGKSINNSTAVFRKLAFLHRKK